MVCQVVNVVQRVVIGNHSACRIIQGTSVDKLTVVYLVRRGAVGEEHCLELTLADRRIPRRVLASDCMTFKEYGARIPELRR